MEPMISKTIVIIENIGAKDIHFTHTSDPWTMHVNFKNNCIDRFFVSLEMRIFSILSFKAGVVAETTSPSAQT